MPKGKIRIRLKSFDHLILDDVCQRLVDTATKTGASFLGPIPLPTRIEKYVVTKSTFVDKDSREYFGLKIHKRLLDVVNPTNQTIDALTHLDLPAGVSVEVKMI
ncbi:MAG: 30S ribosomal protein S10 [Microgenomates bacterium OLB22]|jgi:small subunit ribosomal protein S10|nr:MAG: 30S ribosomal protein S10 [Microgenomates bacterium OLB22]